MSNKPVHKETFFQRGESGIPSAWVVFYWSEDCGPSQGTHKAAYFNEYEEAIEFEKTLDDYEDWYTSQEVTLAVQ